MENTLLHPPIEWNAYDGQQLEITEHSHVFKIQIDNFYESIEKKKCLSDEEYQKAQRFVRSIDKENYIVRKYILRLILSIFLKIPASEITYSYTGKRKPEVSGIHFNVSHTRNYAILALSDYPIGIDIELINTVFDFATLLDLCFRPKEVKFIHDSQNPVINFFTLWTRKEAYLKAIGTGLTEDLINVPALPDDYKNGQVLFDVSSFKIEEQYLASLAIPKNASRPPKYWNVTPDILFYSGF